MERQLPLAYRYGWFAPRQTILADYLEIIQELQFQVRVQLHPYPLEEVLGAVPFPVPLGQVGIFLPGLREDLPPRGFLVKLDIKGFSSKLDMLEPFTYDVHIGGGRQVKKPTMFFGLTVLIGCMKREQRG